MFARARKRDEADVEANLIPIMSCMFLLIPALLLAMEVAPFTSVPVQAPKFCDLADPAEQPTQEPLRLRVVVRQDGFTARYGSSPESERSIDIPLGADGRHDYAALEDRAAELKARFPEDAAVTVTAENSIEFSTLVQSLDALRGQECSLAGAFLGESEPAGCYFWSVTVEAGAAA
jgi:biopolymer transport protein ExbD